MATSNFAKVAAGIHNNLVFNTTKVAAADQDAEWQRVHSYIADVLKDLYTTYSKLARLQGDFLGEELSRLQKISESVLMIGDEFSSFAKAFKSGKYDMAQSEFTYGQEGGAPIQTHKTQQAPIPSSAPAPSPETYDVEPVKVEETESEAKQEPEEEKESEEEQE